MRPVLAQPLACAPAGGGVVVRLRIETDRLVCDRAGTRETLLRWREGRAQLTYSAGPAGADAWSDVWTPGFATTGADPSAAPLVRFELDADGRHIVWIAPAGAPDDEARASGGGR